MKLGGKSILITGSGGFIGSHLVEVLLEKGCHVTAFVQYDSFNRWGWLDSLAAKATQRLEILSGDIRDAYCVKRAMDNQRIRPQQSKIRDLLTLPMYPGMEREDIKYIGKTLEK